MKTDKRSMLLAILGILLLSSAFFNIRGCGRESFEELQAKADAKQKALDSLSAANVSLRAEFDQIQKAVDRRDIEIRDLKIKADSVGRVAESYRAKARSLASDLAKTNAEIDRLTKNPIRRGDQELIDSFKNKYGNP